MSDLLFYTLLTIRLIAPPVVFKYIHPFYAIVIDEVGLDAVLAPHHLLGRFVDKRYNKNRKDIMIYL